MSNENQVLPESNVTETPSTPEVIVEVPVVEEKTHIYQPTDEQGRPIGGKQVIKYTTQDELVNKLQEQNVLILRKLREETRKNRLGISDDAQVSEEAQRFSEPVEFKPIELSSEETFALSRDLMDPERQAQARATLWKSMTGVDPETFNKTINRIQEENMQLQAKIEADAFVTQNKDYVICKENSDALTNWIIRYGLAPTRDNFQRAYDALKAADVIILRGEVPTTVEVLPVQVEIPSPVESVKPDFKPANIPTGFTRDSGVDAAPSPAVVGEDVQWQHPITKQIYVGQKAIDMMPSEELKRRLNSDRNFSRRMVEIEAETAKRRQLTR